MADIEFACPQCNGSLVVDENGAGLKIPCPHCAKQIVIPQPQAAIAPTSQEQTKSDSRRLPPPQRQQRNLASEPARTSHQRGSTMVTGEYLYLIRMNDEQLGPYTMAQLKLLWTTGKLNAAAQFSTNRGEKWWPLLSLRETLEEQDAVKGGAKSYLTVAVCMLFIIAAGLGVWTKFDGIKSFFQNSDALLGVWENEETFSEAMAKARAKPGEKTVNEDGLSSSGITYAAAKGSFQPDKIEFLDQSRAIWGGPTKPRQVPYKRLDAKTLEFNLGGEKPVLYAFSVDNSRLTLMPKDTLTDVLSPATYIKRAQSKDNADKKSKNQVEAALPESAKTAIREFLAVAGQLVSASDVGVSVRDFKDKYSQVKAKYDLLTEEWPSALTEASKRDLLQAMLGWAIAASVAGESMFGTTEGIAKKYLEESQYGIPLDSDNPRVEFNMQKLLFAAGKHFEDGKRKLLLLLSAQ